MPNKADIPSSSDDDASIHIDADSDTIAVLLDVLTGALPTETPPRSFHVIQAVLDFGEQYGFTILPRMILPFMHNYAMSHGWEVFVFAAKNDFPVLAAGSSCCGQAWILRARLSHNIQSELLHVGWYSY
jgi:hypothetical protein